MLTSFQIRLFDLATDPSESANVAAFYPDMVEDILERLRALEETAIPPHVNPNVLRGNPNLSGGFFATGWCDVLGFVGR